MSANQEPGAPGLPRHGEAQHAQSGQQELVPLASSVMDLEELKLFQPGPETQWVRDQLSRIAQSCHRFLVQPEASGASGQAERALTEYRALYLLCEHFGRGIGDVWYAFEPVGNFLMNALDPNRTGWARLDSVPLSQVEQCKQHIAAALERLANLGRIAGKPVRGRQDWGMSTATAVTRYSSFPSALGRRGEYAELHRELDELGLE